MKELRILIYLYVAIWSAVIIQAGCNTHELNQKYPHRRSEAGKNAFKRSHPCPDNGNTHGACPGYVIDHIKPLACGGEDAPSNMQWQTIEEGKAKDKWELKYYCNK
jgi:hypothetical protein